MPDHRTEPRAAAPLFSIIIPLEYHRGQWERSWQGWQSQTLDEVDYEIILVVPPDFPARDWLSRLAAPALRLEYSDHSHDVHLCAVGAASARGRFLFFTESHCWPEPDVLALCLQAFDANPGWAGFSCRSIPISHNRLSEVEADMYEADIEYAMKVHPWRKILDQCFVTRREAYEECGGLKPELGHFSEWALAASYFERGLKIGYLPEARINHYYLGSLAALKAFTLDFVQGEIRYFSDGPREPGNTLLEIPAELICHGNFDRGMAKAILRMVVKDALASRAAEGEWKQAISAAGRWATPAISGDGIARGVAAAAAFHAYLAAMLASVVGSRERLGACFKQYIEALIRYQRLSCLRTRRLGNNAAVLDQAGFYPLEKYQGNQFRWSETAAAIRVRAGAGRRSIRIKCVPVRKLSDDIGLRFYLDGERVADDAISTGTDDFEIRVDVPKSGICKLGWICLPFQANADPRHLGLPVMRVELTSDVSQVKAMEVNSRSLQA